MLDLTIVKAKNPAVAEFLESWVDMYQRQYDFSLPEEQAIFYEGVMELTKHIAKNLPSACLKISNNAMGVSELNISLSP